MNIKIVTTCLFVLLTSITRNVFCQIETMIPKNWKVSKKFKGDFNDDGLSDYFVIIDSVNTENQRLIEGRNILIFHGNSDRLILADVNTLIFRDKRRMVDPNFIDLTVRRNVIFMGIGNITLQNGYNGGLAYTFSHRSNKWYAINCNWAGIKPTQGDTVGGMEEEYFSYNFITKNYKRVLKVNAKTKYKTSAKGNVKEPILFRNYNGDCDESLK